MVMADSVSLPKGFTPAPMAYRERHNLSPNGLHINAEAKQATFVLTRSSTGEDYACAHGIVAWYDAKRDNADTLNAIFVAGGRIVSQIDLGVLVEHIRSWTPRDPTRPGYSPYHWVRPDMFGDIPEPF